MTRLVPLGQKAWINPPTALPQGTNDSSTFTFVPMASVSEQGHLQDVGLRPYNQVNKGYTLFQKDDVLLAKITPCMENGKAALTDKLPTVIGFGSSEFHVLRARPANHPRFLFHMVWNSRFRSEASRNMTGSAGQKRVPKNFLERFEIPDYSYDEQKRIAAVLDRADALRRKRQEALRLTDDFLRSTFLDMFGTTESPTCPRIPICDLITFMTSGGRGWASYYAPEGARFLRSMDVRMNHISDTDAVYVAAPNNAEAKRTMVQPDDVLLTITGSLIGRVAPVPGHLAGAFISQHVAILRLNSILPPKFVSWALSVEEGQRQIQSLQSGQVKPGLNFDQIRKLTVPSPPAQKVKEFLAIVEVAQRKQRTAFEHARETETLFSALQQRAFSGEL